MEFRIGDIVRLLHPEDLGEARRRDPVGTIVMIDGVREGDLARDAKEALADDSPGPDVLRARRYVNVFRDGSDHVIERYLVCFKDGTDEVAFEQDLKRVNH